MSTPRNLSEYYSSRGSVLPSSVAGRFSDSQFSNAAKAAGYDQSSYSINSGNAAANNAILAQLLKGGASTGSPSIDPSTGKTRDVSSIIGNSPVRRYSNPDEYYDAVHGAGPNYDDILGQETRRIQSTIDAVDQIYAGLVTDAHKRGDERMGMTRSIQARNGNLGGSFGEGALNKTADNNREVIQSIEAEKAAKVAQILSSAKQSADNRFASETAAADKKSDDFVKYQKEQSDKFRDDMKNMAATGVQLADITDEDYKNLYDAGGFNSQLAFESYYNAHLPAEEKADYQFINSGGKIARVDKTSGDIKYFDIPGGGLSGKWQLKELKDGSLVKFNPANGEYKPVESDEDISDSTTSAKSMSTLLNEDWKLSDAGLTPGDIVDVRNYLNEGFSLDDIFQTNPDIPEAARSLLRQLVEQETPTETPAAPAPASKSKKRSA